PGGDQGGHRAAVGGRHAGLGEPGGQCAAAGDRLQAAGVAAAARDVVGAGHPDVPDVAGGALGPAVQPPAGDDAAADAGADLDEEQVLRGGAAVPELAQRQGVDVVVDQDVEVVAVGEVAGDGVLVPARHDRRVDRPPGGELDGPGHADADRLDRFQGAARLGEQLPHALLDVP